MNKKFFALTTLMLGMLLLFSGCINIGTGGGNRSIRGTGQVITRDIEVADFNGIRVSGNFSVVYRQASTAALTVSMQENLFNHLDVDVTGGTLQIGSSRTFDTITANRPTLYIYAPYLSAINFSGAITATDWDAIESQSFAIDTSGAATIDLSLVAEQTDINTSGAATLTLDMEVERLYMNVSGAATVRLSGTADNIDVDGSGAFNLRAGDLQIEGGRVNASGAANVYLSTLDNVNVSASGLARVRQAE